MAGELRAWECVRVLSGFGFAVEGDTPIRIVLTRAGERVFIPRHGPIARDELTETLRGAGISEAAFFAARAEHAAARASGVRLRPEGRDSGASPFARWLERFRRSRAG